MSSARQQNRQMRMGPALLGSLAAVAIVGIPFGIIAVIYFQFFG